MIFTSLNCLKSAVSHCYTEHSSKNFDNSYQKSNFCRLATVELILD